jgi:tellurite resistance protein TehA-like permease
VAGKNSLWRHLVLTLFPRGYLVYFIKNIIGGIAVVPFLLLTVTYMVKWMKYPEMIKKEIQHPVSVFFLQLLLFHYC